MNLFADLLASTKNATVTATGPRIQQRRGIEIKSARELKIMTKASSIVATVLREIMDMVDTLESHANKLVQETVKLVNQHGGQTEVLMRGHACLCAARSEAARLCSADARQGHAA